ncbi:MAG: hypothetical protein QXU32_08190 [Nitrososphaerales archaeon]
MVQNTDHILQINVKIPIEEEQIRELQDYFNSLPMEEILLGLRFTYKRWSAKKGGFLMVGRKSKIKREVQLLTADQAKWRLKNWKIMIKNYRDHGYSYPTISRIKRSLQEIAQSR